MFPSSEMAIEVFELAENEDMLSPVEMDPEKLVHKFKEVKSYSRDRQPADLSIVLNVFYK